jgi:uncharacterized protein
MTATTPPVPHRTVPTRRINFEFPAEEVPRHYVRGDLLSSHLMTLGSAVFPEGEDFFVRTVRNYRDRIADPELREQVRGFIGQESMHGRAHRRFNERLAALGYPTRPIDRLTRLGLRRMERLLPRPHQLAVTAALEHYTATLAEALLSKHEMREDLLHDEVRALFLWHALEESEHKAVAFDVFQAVSGNDRIRIGVMRAVTISLVAGIPLGLLVSLLTDPAARRPRTLLRSIRALPDHPLADRRLLDRLRDYNRRAFHPDDHDTTDLLEEWRAALFGDGGVLAASGIATGR